MTVPRLGARTQARSPDSADDPKVPCRLSPHRDVAVSLVVSFGLRLSRNEGLPEEQPRVDGLEFLPVEICTGDRRVAFRPSTPQFAQDPRSLRQPGDERTCTRGRRPRSCCRPPCVLWSGHSAPATREPTADIRIVLRTRCRNGAKRAGERLPPHGRYRCSADHPIVRPLPRDTTRTRPSRLRLFRIDPRRTSTDRGNR